MSLAEYEMAHGLDPGPSLRAALGSLERAVELLPGLEGTHTRLAEAHALHAEWLLARGEDPRPVLELAQRRLQAATRINRQPGPEVTALARRIDALGARARR
jgi:hypothetical protein